MRIGLLGPTGADATIVREAVEFLLRDVEVDHAIYLGEDPAPLDAILRAWTDEMFEGQAPEDAFLDEACALAEFGEPSAIDALLARDALARRLARVRVLPPTPARAIEMIGDRIILAVHDKRVLDEEDIANANLIVYGRSDKADLRKFGPRYFLTPGPLSEGRVAVVEVEGDGHISIALFETSGLPVWRKTMTRRSTKMNVAQ